jgi:HSP20 family protein
MANQNEPNSATQPAAKNQATNQPSQSNQQANQANQANSGMVRRSQDAGMARSQRRGGGLGFPISPLDTLRMSPFGLFRRMTEEFDRALQPLVSGDDATANIAWTPAIEVFESDGKYHVAAELPGLSPNDVQIEVDNDSLILRGERQVEREADQGGVHVSERQFGSFYRRIPLPEGADPGQAKATFRDGVLEIVMPAPKQQTEKRQIQIEGDNKASSGQNKQAAA